MLSRFGGKAVSTRGRSESKPDRESGRRRSLTTPWRIGGLLSLHVQDPGVSQLRGAGQFFLVCLIGQFISLRGCRPLSGRPARIESQLEGVPASASWHTLDHCGRALRRTLAPWPRGEYSSRHNRHRFADALPSPYLQRSSCRSRYSSIHARSCAKTIPARMYMSRHGSPTDRKSTRLNSSHLGISYAVFCL